MIPYAANNLTKLSLRKLKKIRKSLSNAKRIMFRLSSVDKTDKGYSSVPLIGMMLRKEHALNSLIGLKKSAIHLNMILRNGRNLLI